MIKNIINDIEIKDIKKDYFDEALSFVWDVFQDYEAPDYMSNWLELSPQEVREHILHYFLWMEIIIGKGLGKSYFKKYWNAVMLKN